MRGEVGVLIPVAPEAPWLGECLASLMHQTFEDWVALVLLDGDCRSNRAVLESANLGDRLVTRVLPANTGVARALNVGLASVNAEYVARMDADDACVPARFAVQVEVMRAKRDLWALGTSARLIDEAGDTIGWRQVPTGRVRVKRALGWHNVVIHPSVMLRRQAVLSVGGYNERSNRAQDYELWLRIAQHGALDNLAVPLLNYRIHSRQHSRGTRMQGTTEIRRARLEGARSLRRRVECEIQHGAWLTVQRLREPR